MLHTISSPANKVNQRQVKSFAFTKMFDRIDDKDIHARAERGLRRFSRTIFRLGGECNWPVRRIAAHLKVSVRTFQRYQAIWEATFEIEVERPPRKKGCRLSQTNIYRLGNGGGDTAVTQVLTTRVKTLKTNTPAVAVAITEPDDDPETNPQDIPAPPAPSYPPPTPAQRRKNHHDHHRQLQRWEHNQRMKRHREQRERELAERRNRIALEARVGVWPPLATTPKPDDAQSQRDREEILFYWRRMKAKGAAIYRDCPYGIRCILESEEVKCDVAHGATKREFENVQS